MIEEVDLKYLGGIMDIIIIIIGLFLIIWEDANKNVLTPKQQQKLLEIKPLIDRERQLREDLFGGKIFKK